MIHGVLILNRSGALLTSYPINVHGNYIDVISKLVNSGVRIDSASKGDRKFLFYWGDVVNTVLIVDVGDLREHYINLAEIISGSFMSAYNKFKEKIEAGEQIFKGFGNVISNLINLSNNLREGISLVVNPLIINTTCGEQFSVEYIFNFAKNFNPNYTINVIEIRNILDPTSMEIINAPGMVFGNTMQLNAQINYPQRIFTIAYRCNRTQVTHIQPHAIIQTTIQGKIFNEYIITQQPMVINCKC